MNTYAYVDEATEDFPSGLVLTSISAGEPQLIKLINNGTINPISAIMDITDLQATDRCKEDPHGDSFEAWDLDDYDNPTEIVLNIDKLKVMWLEGIRLARNSRLDYLDGLTLRAVSRNQQGEIARIETIKSALRELPEELSTSLDTAKTATDVFNIQPGVLHAE